MNRARYASTSKASLNKLTCFFLERIAIAVSLSVDLEYFQKPNGKNGRVKWSEQTTRSGIAMIRMQIMYCALNEL
jgi:hypothetical protein